jgi:hypothetical protein
MFSELPADDQAPPHLHPCSSRETAPHLPPTTQGITSIEEWRNFLHEVASLPSPPLPL